MQPTSHHRQGWFSRWWLRLTPHPVPLPGYVGGEEETPARGQESGRQSARQATELSASSEACVQSPAFLAVRNLGKGYGAGASRREVLRDVNLAVKRSEFISIVGPSGCGKTTLLRCIAGLTRPSAGVVQVNGRQVTEPPPEIAVVFQDYSRSLLPWATVLDNVILPLRSKGLNKQERTTRAEEALDAVGLSGTERRYPWQLSGGMQQRVTLARALAYRPEAVLMDEPFASVDAQTRLDLEDLVVRVRAQYQMTTLFVTHDIDEAVYLSDQVVVLAGTPTTVRRVVEIDLGSVRDQIETRSMPEFAHYRAMILKEIRVGPPRHDAPVEAEG
jgi:NitT/TauT family transport system ATP-binding protein